MPGPVIIISLCLLSFSTVGADKLIIKNNTGTNAVFKVDHTDTVQVVQIDIGAANPASTIHCVETAG